MDRISFIDKLKNILLEIMLKYPKTIEIKRKDYFLNIKLSYPYSYEVRDFYNENKFLRDGEIRINLIDDDRKDLIKHINQLLKIKRFLKYKFPN